MRQILIAKNPQIKELSSHRVTLVAGKDSLKLIRGTGLTLTRIPLTFDVLTGGHVTFKFDLPLLLFKKGVLLAGAYWDGNEVEVAFMSSTGADVEITEGLPILVGTLIETVRFRQIDSTVLGNLTIVKTEGNKALKIEKKKKGKKNA